MGSGGPANYRWGYRDASGTWFDGENAPAGAVVGHFDEARRAWVEGVPAGWATTYRMGYGDAATGQWIEGAPAPAGSVIGWWDEDRKVWVEGVPRGSGDRAGQRPAGAPDSYVAPEPVTEKKSNWLPWLLAALAAAGLLYGLIKLRETPAVGVVATPAAVATVAAETPAAMVDATAATAPTAPAAPAATATTAPAPAATDASPAAEAAVAAAMAAPCVPKITAPDAFIAGLKEADLPIGETVVYTAGNDPDGLLGKDGGYDAAFGFADTSLPAAAGPAGGGVIEFFRNPDLARVRAGKAAVDARGEIREFFGPILVRLSGKMDQKQVDAYGAAIAGLTGCEAVR